MALFSRVREEKSLSNKFDAKPKYVLVFSLKITK